MSLYQWFHLLEHVTLGLSCAALVFAEDSFLPDLQVCLAPVLMLLLLAWGIQGRWSLPNWGANILGLASVAGGVFLMVEQLTDDQFVLSQLPLQLALLPYMGPLLMAALLVKVFQSHDAAAFWYVQGLGLMQVGLGCVLDDSLPFGIAMTAYLASALVCLALRYRLSSSRVLPKTTAAGGKRAAEGGWWLLSFTPRWTLLVAGPALVLFLLTPRRDEWAWQPLHHYRSGYSRSHGQEDREEINLNNIGRIALDDSIALQVAAADANGKPKLDLPVEQQHWRGAVLDFYDKGKWVMYKTQAIAMDNGQKHLPDFGGDQYTLTFRVQPRQAGGLMLAEPIRFGPPLRRLPVLALADEDQPARGGDAPPHPSRPRTGRTPLFGEFLGTVLPQTLSNNPQREYRYRQVVPARGDPARTTAEGIVGSRDLERLVDVPTSLRIDLQYWIVDLLRRLSQHPRYPLPESVRAALAETPGSFFVYPEDWERVARVLTTYLAHSGEFTYSLEITHHDRSIDPVLDFLIHTKQGHCELYAAGLALMLRSVGIPARLVKGFRGCDHQGNGQYLIRHRHAHAWVEILVPHSSARGQEGADKATSGGSWEFDWLTLDATPAESTVAGTSFSLPYLWEEAQRICLQSWRSLIVEYNGEEQAGLWGMLKSGEPAPALLSLILAALASGAAFAAWLFLRRQRRRRRPACVLGAASAFYLRFVRILERYAALRPNFAQTPREYSESARDFLQARPTLAALAVLPRRIIDLFYRARFGGRPLTEGESQRLNTEMDRFAAALQLFSREP